MKLYRSVLFDVKILSSRMYVVFERLVNCLCFVLLDACTIMSYYILADYNSRKHPDLYWDVPWDAMRWDSRSRLITREIRHWEPDLVCLQVKTHSVILHTGWVILALHSEHFFWVGN
jgi:hypothetical protein